MTEKRKTRGSTLIELMISCGIFAFLTSTLVALVLLGTNSWRKIESRYAAERDIQRSVVDINTYLRNSDMLSFSSGSSSDGFWMAFKTAIPKPNSNEPATFARKHSFVGRDQKVVEPDAADPSKLDQPSGYVDTETYQNHVEITWSHFVIYYLTPQSKEGGGGQEIIGNDLQGNEYKLYELHRCFAEIPVTAGVQDSKLANFPSSVTHDLLLAKDIVIFTAKSCNNTKDDGSGNDLSVSYHIKGFKRLESSKGRTNSEGKVPERFFMELRYTVTPLCNDASLYN